MLGEIFGLRAGLIRCAELPLFFDDLSLLLTADVGDLMPLASGLPAADPGFDLLSPLVRTLGCSRTTGVCCAVVVESLFETGAAASGKERNSMF